MTYIRKSSIEGLEYVDKDIFRNIYDTIKTNNIAIRASKGDFILRLDADDYLDPNALLVLFPRNSFKR